MTILIYDNSNRHRAFAMARAFARDQVQALYCYCDVFFDAAGQPSQANVQRFDLILYHQSDAAAFAAANLESPCTISYSGGSEADIPRPLTAGNILTEGEADHIVRALKDGPADLRRRLLSYWAENRAARVALRMLCEAWRLNAGTAQGTHHGIIICAPVLAEQWFTPFGQKPDEEGSRARIAEQMGSARRQAATLLQRVAAAGAGGNAGSYSELERDIHALIEDLNAAYFG